MGSGSEGLHRTLFQTNHESCFQTAHWKSEVGRLEHILPPSFKLSSVQISTLEVLQIIPNSFCLIHISSKNPKGGFPPGRRRKPSVHPGHLPLRQKWAWWVAGRRFAGQESCTANQHMLVNAGDVMVMVTRMTRMMRIIRMRMVRMARMITMMLISPTARQKDGIASHQCNRWLPPVPLARGDQRVLPTHQNGMKPLRSLNSRINLKHKLWTPRY